MHGNASKRELRIACDQYGSPTYVPHLAQAVANLIRTEAFGTFHLAGQGCASRWDLVAELFTILKIKTRIWPVSSRAFPISAKRPAYSALATAQSPRIELPPWQEGVREFALRTG
jgi:dTDP-4-dehydrorhamnose reductase